MGHQNTLFYELQIKLAFAIQRQLLFFCILKINIIQESRNVNEIFLYLSPKLPCFALSAYFCLFLFFITHWLETYCFPPLYCEGTDIDKRDGVNMQDLHEFTIDWLNSN